MHRLIRSLLILSLLPMSPSQISLARETPLESKEASAPGESPKTQREVAPETTPYDSDPKERERFLGGYRDGRDWAIHPERTDETARSSVARNGAATHGFIEGWKAGVKATPPGVPTGALPARYAPFIAWKPEPDWDAIRATRIKAHNPETSTEFAGRWRMTLPRGFQYDIELARAEGEKGLLEMKSRRGGICLLGTYSFTGDRLQLVDPKDRDGVQDLDWRYRDGVFILEAQSVRNAGDYVGAKLERVN